MKSATWQNPGQLIVAQDYIINFNLKWCGIKVYLGKNWSIVLGLVRLFLGTMGPLFKIQHYPGATMIWTLGLLWYAVDFAILWKLVDIANRGCEEEIDSVADDTQQQGAAPDEALHLQEARESRSIDAQMDRAGKLLKLGIIDSSEFGSMCANIASGSFVLSYDAFRDVKNLHDMKERQSIDDFVYDMQRVKILELKYIPEKSIVQEP